ncbi:probable UDP-N-acetylglucosamine--peptide N-acetylglucosaminyltransferase SEC isoform X1 [Humulus lupulus]|uniref:probable UDP-N-acetylglucosamine--peptide N-acetylglucosaminyltransferase SEC isoform X1 n=1 Tax=Humulus lupulus TaxID=3486 RepID=UPI002B40EAE8|nr:probable UDP-N-acetylglucosamine--peptide N-acetylglucosaminyltransferase SEC isoform X1 [Humulus lupulus]
MKVVCHELTQAINDPEGSAMDELIKDADRLVSCLANKVAKTFDFSLTGASSRSCKYVLNTLMQCVCDWDDHENKFIEVEGILRRQIKMSLIPSVQPFHAIAYPIDPMLALEISRKYAAHCSVIASRFSLPSFNYPAALPIKSEGGSKRLRAG